MNSDELKQFATQNGLTAFYVPFDVAPCLFVGRDEYQDPILGTVWKDGIFIFQEEDEWVIGFSQSARTRKMNKEELMAAILDWQAGNKPQ